MGIDYTQDAKEFLRNFDKMSEEDQKRFVCEWRAQILKRTFEEMKEMREKQTFNILFERNDGNE